MDQYLKACSKCHKVLPRTSFAKDRTSPDGYQHWCRECMSNHRKIKRELRNGKATTMSSIFDSEPYLTAVCGRTFKSAGAMKMHQRACVKCQTATTSEPPKEKSSTIMAKQTDDEFICQARCGKVFKTVQERHVHESMCIDCMEIERGIQPIQTEAPMEASVSGSANGASPSQSRINEIITKMDAFLDAEITQPQDAPSTSTPHVSEVLNELREVPSIALPSAAPPQLVRVGPYLVGIASIALIDIRKDNRVDVTLNVLQINASGRTESVSLNLEADDGAALIASLEPVTTSAPSGILEKMRGQSESLREAQQKIHELEADIERHIKERETAMDIALKADEELNRYKKVLSQLG